MSDPFEAAIEAALMQGAVSALRKRAKVQADRAANGSGEAAMALRLAADLTRIANDVEAGR
jgi:hypothetical protein